MKSKLKLKQVELIFENCEYCIIPAKYIHNLSIDEFDNRIHFGQINGLLEFLHCRLDRLEISNEFLINAHSQFNENNINENQTLLDRLKENDVVAIELVYFKNKRSKEYYLPWNEENEYHNKYQKFTEGEKTSILRVSKEDDSNG